jgi:hypothetical protein
MTYVFVLTVEHRHGRDISVSETEDGAWASLYNWVQLFWDQDCEGLEMPDDSEIAIEKYFEHVTYEWYRIQKVPLYKEE